MTKGRTVSTGRKTSVWLRALAIQGCMLANVGVAEAQGDPVKGQTVFARCAACHSMKSGERRIGPSLHGLAGRKAGTVAGITYSPALKGSSITWNAKTLDAFLTSPSKAIPGNKMMFMGLADPQARKNVIAYLLGPGKAVK